MAPRRHLVGRRLRQLATKNATAVSTTNEQIPTWVVITVASAVGLVACLLLVVLIIVILMQKKGTKPAPTGGSGPSKQLLSGNGSSGDVRRELIPKEADGWPFCLHPIEPVPQTVESRMRKYSMAEVRRATHDFSEEGLLGEGRYGGVFRGTLDDGSPVAVKRMRVEHVRGELTKFGNRAEKEFLSEAEVIVRVHHRHLLPLIGYCSTRDERILILMYMEKGTLEAKLQHQEDVLDWNSRMRIAVGSAKGIAYLHEDCFPGIIHRDIKSSNILLDEFHEPRVADFGFARSKELGSKDFGSRSSSVQTQVVGTPGYLPIECVLFGQNNSYKSDVYSFGVVLLELLTGRPPVDMGEKGSKKTLANMARESADYGGGLEDMIDPALEQYYNSEEALRMWNTALQCVSEDPSRRPRMGQVLLMLKGKHPALAPSPDVRRFPRAASPRDRRPQNLRTSEKVDLWPRAAGSPLTRGIGPGRVSPQSPATNILRSSFHPSDIRPADSSLPKPLVLDDSDEIRPESPESVLLRRKVGGPEYAAVLHEDEDGRDSTLLEEQGRLEHGFRREEYEPHDPLERDDGSEVWKEDDVGGFMLTNLRTSPGQASRYYGSGSPVLDTWLGGGAAASPRFGEREGKIFSRSLEGFPGSGSSSGVRSQSERFSIPRHRTPNRRPHSERYKRRSEMTPDKGGIPKSADWGDRKLTRSQSNPLFSETSLNSNPLLSAKPRAAEGVDAEGTLKGTRMTGVEVHSEKTAKASPSEDFLIPKIY